ncbi:hypothetical protein LASUN_13170 [Lentilactobacillus sunkii]|jgi:hypothetical protein|uniref:Uncharacterized protein n=1 Tax=Lentilactobacillus sunkii TaxID=481719 RepID=A0A1E7XCC8_9LACO|nr:hypothetical protein [Lentilactobacillus sunkii]OFA10767.1 hypothetical protein LASUN_13170 [Lentilactobacillus sunkii]
MDLRLDEIQALKTKQDEKIHMLSMQLSKLMSQTIDDYADIINKDDIPFIDYFGTRGFLKNEIYISRQHTWTWNFTNIDNFSDASNSKQYSVEEIVGEGGFREAVAAIASPQFYIDEYIKQYEAEIDHLGK